MGIRAGWATDPLDKRRVLRDGTYQYQYDDEGNLTRKQEISSGKVTTYVWDDRNRLSRVNLSNGSSVEYGYDAEDRRVSKQINGVVKEKYVYDGLDIALVVDASGTIVERYLYGDGVDNVLSVVKAGTTVWSLADRQGSITDLVDATGAVLNHFVYDSFGNRTANTAADFRYGYTARELDLESGLNYYRARYYDSNVGRFISVDPMGFDAGDTNLYRYVSNNSTNAIDPSGNLPIPLLALGGIALVGAGIAAFQNYSYQKAQLADGIHPNNSQNGNKADVNYGDVAFSAVTGGVFAPLAALGVTTAPLAAVPLIGLGVLSGLQNHSDAQAEYRAGHTNTAWYHLTMAYVDIFTVGILSGTSRPPSSLSPAFAGGAFATAVPSLSLSLLSGVGIGLIGSNAGKLFQHYFASDNTNNPEGNGNVPDNRYGNDTGWEGAVTNKGKIQVGDDFIPGRKPTLDPFGEPINSDNSPTRGILHAFTEARQAIKSRIASVRAYNKQKRQDIETLAIQYTEIIIKEYGINDPNTIRAIENSLKHAEGRAALEVRINNLKNARLNINQGECGFCRSSDSVSSSSGEPIGGADGIRYILGEGKSLTVNSPVYDRYGNKIGETSQPYTGMEKNARK